MRKNNSLFIVLGLMLLAALTRLIPHAPNFTAVMAVALFGGVQFRKPALAVIVPLAVMFVTDIFIGFYSLMPWVYGCIAVTALMGTYISKQQRPMHIIGASLLSSILFFAVTNAAVWFHNPLYAQTFSGLMLCYDIAIPFFRNQVFGDLFFNAILFGTYALATKRLVTAKA